jgi:hypothetical protein
MARQLGVSRGWITQYFRVAGDSVVSEHVQTEALSVAKAYDIVLAEDDRTRDAALRAALGGAPRRLVRRLAKECLGAEGPGDGSAADSGDDGAAGTRVDAPHGDGGRDHDAQRGPPPAPGVTEARPLPPHPSTRGYAISPTSRRPSALPAGGATSN